MTQEWHKLESSECINLNKCLSSGQNFTYIASNKTYIITLTAIDISLKELNDEIYYLESFYEKSYIERLLRNFFTLQIDYRPLFEKWKIEYTGLRLLKIDIIECIFTFICSQNNNLQRIKKMADTLKIVSNNFTYFYFEELVGFGYRGKYIIEAGIKINSIITSYFENLVNKINIKVYEKSAHTYAQSSCLSTYENLILTTIRDRYNYKVNLFIESFKTEKDFGLKHAYAQVVDSIFINYSFDVAEKFLLSFKGIGRKVCDCILLNGYGFYNVIPLDVHMLRVSKEIGFNDLKQDIPKQYIEKYGEYCGIAQIYLFFNSVNKKKQTTRRLISKS